MSRFQAPPAPKSSENPNLTPLTAQVDPWANRGRFQQVNLGTSSAEDRTKLAPGVTWENRFQVPKIQRSQNVTSSTTSSPAATSHDDGKKQVVQEEETTTTVIED